MMRAMPCLLEAVHAGRWCCVALSRCAAHGAAPAPPLVSIARRYDNLPPNDAHLQRIADHVSAYLQIVRSQLLATVPKAVVHCMVRRGAGSQCQVAVPRGRQQTGGAALHASIRCGSCGAG